MRLKLLTAFLFFTTIFSSQNIIAQSLAVNTTGAVADNSAILDITSTAKGMLIPRMTKDEKNGIVAPATGLLVYQSGPDSTGFHYFNGTLWVWLANADAKLGWLTTGNNGTDTAINFLGTLDNKPLMLRQNNFWMGQLNTSKKNYFIGAASGFNNASGILLSAFGDSALFNNTTGNGNTAFGSGALKGLKGAITGHVNVAVGNNAMPSITTGGQNIAIGDNAMFSNETGAINVAIGAGAFENAKKGDGNISIGLWSQRLNDSGYNNIAIGTQALYNNDSSRNTAVGFQSLFYNNRFNNVAYGYGSGTIASYLQTDPLLGIENTYIGYASGYYTNTGSKNVAVGNRALQGMGYFNGDVPGNDNYKRNVAVGDSAMLYAVGSDNVAIGFKTLSNSQYGGRHVAIGSRALSSTSSTYPNTAIGYLSMDSITTTGANTALGSYTLATAKTGSANTAIGNAAMYEAGVTWATLTNNTAVGNNSFRKGRYYGNSAFGSEALSADTSGIWNTAIGNVSMEKNLSGILNAGVGVSSLRNNTIGSFNTAMGSNALYAQDTADRVTAVGYEALFYNNRDFNTAVGVHAGWGNSWNSNNINEGDENTMIGYGALSGNGYGSKNVAVGHMAMSIFTPASFISGGTPSQNVGVGDSALQQNRGNNNTAIGFRALSKNFTAVGNTALGSYALSNHQNDNYNTALGFESMVEDTTGFLNTAVGWRSLRKVFKGEENTAIGVGAIEFSDSAKWNTAVGRGAMISRGGEGNTAIGYYASGFNTTTNTANIKYTTTVGYLAGYKNYADENTFVGANAGYGATVNDSISGIENVGIGAYTLTFLTSGKSNTAVGLGPMYFNTTGKGNVAIGTRALVDNRVGNYNVAVGDSALFWNRSSLNVGVGNRALFANINGSSNTAIGNSSLSKLNGGLYNVSMGDSSSTNLVLGSNNVVMGSWAFKDHTIGSRNTAIGNFAMGERESGNDNTAVGEGSLWNTNNNLNTGIGSRAGFTNVSGVRNVFLGANTDAQFDNLINAAAIGANAYVGQSNSIVLGSINGINAATSSTKVGIGTIVPDSTLSIANNFSVGSVGTVQFPNTETMINMFRTGTNNPDRMVFAHSRAYQNWGLQYRDNIDQFNFIGGGVVAMSVRLSGGVGIGTAAPSYQLEVSTNSAGKPGSSFWTISSDERLKDIHGSYTKGLAEILKLNTIKYHYKKDNKLNLPSNEEFYGFSAQEVQKVFPEAVKKNENGYLSLDIQPIIMAYINAFIEQEAILDKQQQELKDQKNTINQLLKRIEAIEKKNNH